MNNSEKGYRAEEEFGVELWMRYGVQPIKSEGMEDMGSHWDWKLQGFKYDVKSKKSMDRKHLWIEFRNVRGRKGWLFGEADVLAFDRDKYWMLVNRQKLVDVLAPDMDFETMFEDVSEKVPWRMYRRLNRVDGVVLVPIIKLLETEPTMWWKR